MSTLKTIAEGTFARGLADVAVQGLSLIGYFLTVRALTLHDYGVIVLIFSLLAPSSEAVTLGLPRLFVAEVARLRGEERMARMLGFIKGYVRMAFWFTAALLAAAFIAREVIEQFREVYLFRFFWIAVGVVVSQLFLNMILLSLEAFEQFKTLSALQLFETAVRTSGIVILFFTGTFSIISVVLMYSAGKFIAALAGAPFVARTIRGAAAQVTQIEQGVFRQVLREYGKWDIVKTIAGRMITSVRLWILKFVVNTEAVAVYDFVYKFHSLIVTIVPLRSVLFPVINRTIHDRALVTLIITKAKKYLLLYYSAAYLASAVVLPPLIAAVFPQYAPWTFAVFVALLMLFWDVGTVGQGPLFYAERKQKVLLVIYMADLVVQIIMDVLLSVLFGVVGLIVSTQLLLIVVTIVREYYLRVYMGLRTLDRRAFFSFDEYDRLILSKIKEKCLAFIFHRI